jgi:protein SCO1/2
MQIKKIATLTTLLSLTLVSMVPQKSSAPFKILSLNEHLPSSQINRTRLVPDFSLTERSGRKTSLADLRGKIWIADFIYTQCSDTCPLQTADMAKLQQQWINQSDLRLVSFSVDPERDTPAVLSRYAARFKADAQRWLFLTGNKDEMARLVEDGFRLLASSPKSLLRGKPLVLHSPRFILVDRQAQVRGSYDSRDSQSKQRLISDVANLLNAPLDAPAKNPIDKSEAIRRQISFLQRQVTG